MKAKAKEIVNFIVNQGYNTSLAQIIAAQAAHETAGYISPLYLLNKNLFGMMYAGQQYASGERAGYAYYDSDNNSILDLLDWLQLNGSINTDNIAVYVSFIKEHNYFDANIVDYTAGVIAWYKKLFS